MADREKVIAWLADEELYYREHGDAHNSLMACDALELLEKQQPRVLPKEELYALPDETDVWCEQRDSKRIFAMTTLGEEYFKLQPTFATGLGLNDIRIWTARPTEKQRKAVPWGAYIEPKDGD